MKTINHFSFHIWWKKEKNGAILDLFELPNEKDAALKF